jgi:hypothetical protein
MVCGFHANRNQNSNLSAVQSVHNKDATENKNTVILSSSSWKKQGATMGGEAYATSQLVYGIVLPEDKVKEAIKQKKGVVYEEESDVQKALIAELTEGDGLYILVLESYGQASGESHRITLLVDEECVDTFVANASTDKVGVCDGIPATLPDVTMDMSEVHSFCERLNFRLTKTVKPKWMMVNTCQMLE